MIQRSFLKCLASALTIAAFVLGGVLIFALPIRGSDDDDKENDRGNDRDARVTQGFALAAASGIRLNMTGKDPAKVGLGSYLVNAVGGCNDCHTNPPFTPGHDPTLGQPKQINAAAYLAGGAVFIPAHPPNFPAIVARNLTPDKTGRPEGGEARRLPQQNPR